MTITVTNTGQVINNEKDRCSCRSRWGNFAIGRKTLKKPTVKSYCFMN